MTQIRLWRKLMTTFMLLGLVNIIFAFAVFYFSSVNLLEERAGQQMASVRALTSQRMTVYLDSLKEKMEKDGGYAGREVVSVLDAKAAPEKYLKLPLSRFMSLDNDLIFYRTQKKIWLFNTEGLSGVLNLREGLGRTGEIYIVGDDGKLKSHSRHLQKSNELRVDNESFRLAHQNKNGVHVVRDYRNVEVVSSYSSFNYDDLNFVVLSEIDKEEVFSPLYETFPRSFLLTLGILFATLVVSYFYSKQIVDLVERMREQINGLNFRVLTAQEEEKRRIALDLHDGVGQSLTALKWSLAAMASSGDLSKLPTAVKLSEEAIADIRDVSMDLMPSSLKEMGCYSAIREYLQRQQESLNIKVDFWFSQQLEELKFRDGMDVNVYRMVQELVQNSLKHAKASSLSLVILKQEDNFLLRFEDDGEGMSEDSPMPRTLNFRTQILGGTMTRESDTHKLVFIITAPLKNLFV